MHRPPTTDHRPPTTDHGPPTTDQVQHSIIVQRSARYETLGPERDAIREVWFALHGYGQLAAQFIEVFASLDDGTRLIVAPEALNRFYLVNVDTTPAAADRAVGATWMTREDRDNEIADYVAYLDAIARDVLARYPSASQAPRTVALGFSQGAATAVRWIANGALRPTHAVLWGGFLPPEIDNEERARPLRDLELFLVVGSRDRYISSERLSDEETRCRSMDVRYRLIRYEGGHGVARAALGDVAAAIRGT